MRCQPQRRSTHDIDQTRETRMNTVASLLRFAQPSWLAARLTRWSPLPLRFIVGYGFMAHGYAKVVKHPENFAAILHALARLQGLAARSVVRHRRLRSAPIFSLDDMNEATQARDFDVRVSARKAGISCNQFSPQPDLSDSKPDSAAAA
jgi:hypothetical protein